jgi:uncharacterized protein DUF3987
MSQSQPVDEFPIWVLPNRVLLFVLEAAEALGIDPAIIAGPCLASLAGCIGNRRRIIVNPGAWHEACVLWVAVVLRSGGRKTPAIHMVLEHLHQREVREIEEEKARQAEYEEEMRQWKSDKQGEPPEKPEPAMRLLVSDITIEGLLALHARAPLGLLLYRDELGGWLRSYNQYKGGGRGSDAQTWSEMHQGRPALIDRKVSPTLSVPRASVSIVGGIQPELLRNAIAGEHLFDGIASRILFVVPPEKVKTWTDGTISDEAREGWANLLDELLALQPDKDGNPVALPMTDKAKAAWIRYYNEHAKREEEAEGPFRSALSKLEAATARLALIIQLAEDPRSMRVGVKAMKAGIAISEWFEGQARRVYTGFEESEQERDRRAVYDWIAKQGGSTTKRDLARLGPLRFRGRAEEVLADLVAAGLAKLTTPSGRLAGKYVLCDRDSSDGGAQ